MELIMFKKIRYLIITVIISLTLIISASASDIVKYTVVKGDSMWKIATRYQVGVDEIILANPQVKNPSLIYPGQILTIPLIPKAITDLKMR
jgi:spore coat assembly protein SafA